MAFAFVKLLRFFRDRFLAKRYGHRAVVLGRWRRCRAWWADCGNTDRALRTIGRDGGKMKKKKAGFRTLLDEAENERMHLMTFIEIAQPNAFERLSGRRGAVGVPTISDFFLYLFAPRTAHRVVAYFEEEAVFSLHPIPRRGGRGAAGRMCLRRKSRSITGSSRKTLRLRDVIIAVPRRRAEQPRL